MKGIKILVEVSARHCHLSQRDLEKLFGEGYELTKTKQLSQPSDFACKETVAVEFGDKKFENVRVVGPVRPQTQVEISLTDAIGSGILPQLRVSGDLKHSSGAVLCGPQGRAKIEDGVIVAQRHIHCSPEEAKNIKAKNGDIVSVETKGLRPIIFQDVVVRVKEGYKLCMQIDTDEGNAAGIHKIGEGTIIK
ncbi:MAG: phosphate propanoyltransferase [Candidatus Staskawiczbacteria bacterium]|nr:phosphate propanoyltransferase [Candidatus Staskawiczbacteria bacterium]